MSSGDTRTEPRLLIEGRPACILEGVVEHALGGLPSAQLRVIVEKGLPTRGAKVILEWTARARFEFRVRDFVSLKRISNSGHQCHLELVDAIAMEPEFRLFGDPEISLPNLIKRYTKLSGKKCADETAGVFLDRVAVADCLEEAAGRTQTQFVRDPRNSAYPIRFLADKRRSFEAPPVETHARADGQLALFRGAETPMPGEFIGNGHDSLTVVSVEHRWDGHSYSSEAVCGSVPAPIRHYPRGGYRRRGRLIRLDPPVVSLDFSDWCMPAADVRVQLYRQQGFEYYEDIPLKTGCDILVDVPLNGISTSPLPACALAPADIPGTYAKDICGFQVTCASDREFSVRGPGDVIIHSDRELKLEGQKIRMVTEY